MATKIICKKCGDVIESKSRHDMVWCRCGSVAIDGGEDYCKITGNPDDWEYYKEKEKSMKIRAPKIYAVYAHYIKNVPPNKYLIPAYSERQAKVLFKKNYSWLDIIYKVEEYTKGDNTK